MEVLFLPHFYSVGKWKNQLFGIVEIIKQLLDFIPS